MPDDELKALFYSRFPAVAVLAHIGAFAVELAWTLAMEPGPDREKAFSATAGGAGPVPAEVFSALYGAARIQDAFDRDVCRRERLHSEDDIRRAFVSSLDTLLPGARLEKISHGELEGRCDVLLNIDAQLVPVEVKRDKFCRAAVKQLKRYIHFYKAPYGIAVAPTLLAELPDDITFVKVDPPDMSDAT